MHAPSPDRLARAIVYADRLAAGVTPGAALDHVEDAVVVTDSRLDRPGPTITFVNAAFEQLSGYDRQEVLGESPRLLQGYDTDPGELARMRAALSAETCFEGSVVNYSKSGLEYVIGWAVAPVRNAQGDVCSWLSVQSDALETGRATRPAGQSAA